MRDILIRLREDAGQLTLAILIQEREAAASAIEQLRNQLRQPIAAEAAPRPNPHQVLPVRRPDPSVKSRFFQPHALLRLEDVRNLVGMSRSTIYKRISEHSFPSPIRISERSVRWRLEDLEEWIRNPVLGTRSWVASDRP